jgi:putative ABC transport system substrate-binding protein
MPARGRRQFLQRTLALAGTSLLAGCRAVPPPSSRSVKIGVLSIQAIDPSPEGTAFRAALRELGYAEGQNLALVFRRAGLPETLTSTAAELVGQGVDVIVTMDDEATQAARHASDTVPIVMVDSIDPVHTGLIASLGRPGSNITGLTSLAAALGPKRLELLRALTPGVSRVAFLWWARTGEPPDLRVLRAAAQGMGVQIVPVIDRNTTNMTLALAGLANPVEGIIVLTLASARADAARLVASLNETRLPAIYDGGSFARAGGLLAYGANTPELFRRSAGYVDKILKGAKPAELPVEQPTKFDLIVNLKAASALGLTVPASILQQATEIIQ